ncbi:MAG: AAA family ATPase [bacterium]
MKIWLVIGLCFILFSGVPAKAAENAQGYFNKASLQYLVGDLEEAIRNIDQALKLNPKHVGAQQLRQTIRREQNLPTEPTVDAGKLFADHFRQGRDLYGQGEFVKAVNNLSEAVILNPRHQEAKDLLVKAMVGIRYAEQRRGRYFIGMVVSAGIGLLSLGFLLSTLAVSAQRKFVSRLDVQNDGKHCFNCQAKISPNIDLCPNCGAWVGAKMRRAISHDQSSWLKRLGWRKNPFTLDIHPELFTGYRKEVKEILEKLSSRSGHILITGPLGVGKTTLLRWLASFLRKDSFPIYIPRPPLEFDQVIKLIAENLGVYQKGKLDYDIYHLNRLRKKADKPLVLLMDEAHEFSVELERPLRTLGDLDNVNLIMAGLPETVDKLANEIRPLYERLVLQIDLEKLQYDDIKEMIKARIESVGGQGIFPFTDGAIEAIYKISKGIPRTVVKMCDWAITRAINQHDDKIEAEPLMAYKI